MYNENRWHVGRWIGIGFLAVFAVFVASMILYMFLVVPAGGMPMGSYAYFPFGWIWILLGFFLFFGLLRWALFPWRWMGYPRHYMRGYGREKEAYHILRERYARGEITKDEYDRMMRDLYSVPREGP